jgi:hypothetical protein
MGIQLWKSKVVVGFDPALNLAPARNVRMDTRVRGHILFVCHAAIMCESYVASKGASMAN